MTAGEDVQAAPKPTQADVLDLFIEFIRSRRGWTLYKLESMGPKFDAQLCRQDLVEFLQAFKDAQP